MIKHTEREAVMQLWVKCWMVITGDLRIVSVTGAVANIKSIYSNCLSLNIQWQFPKAEGKNKTALFCSENKEVSPRLNYKAAVTCEKNQISN